MDLRWIPFGATLLVAWPAIAQDASETAPVAAGISVELNAAAASEAGGCTLSFVVDNSTDTDLESVVYETVLFDAAGQVDRLTLLDFGALPKDRSRVRQFTMPDRGCDDYGRILFNGAATCEASQGGLDICGSALRLESRTEIEVQG